MLRFLSLATLSQAAIVAQQLALLPLQIHVWGHAEVALWLGLIALVNLMGSADLGLRNLGFAALTGGLPRERLAPIWTLTRLHILALTPLIAAAAFALFGARAGADGALLLALFIAIGAVEAVFYIRVAFMEARGRIARSEAIFLGLMVTRVGAGVVALALFEAHATALAAIWLLTGVGAVVAQSAALRDVAPVFGAWRLARVRESYRAAGWAGSEPVAVWMQLQAPVIALSTFAAPALVSAFVATRVLFGLFRSMLQQLARIGSVRYVDQLRAAGPARARSDLLLLAAFCSWLGAGVALAIAAERFWFTGGLFDLPADPLVRLMILGFSLSAILSVHQLFVLSLMREGVIVASGAANWAHIGALAVACLLAVAAQNVSLLIIALVFSDLLMLGLIGRPFWADRTAEIAGARRLFLIGVLLSIGLAVGGWLHFMQAAAPHTNLWTLVRDEALAFVLWLGAGGLFWALAGKRVRAGFAAKPLPG